MEYKVYLYFSDTFEDSLKAPAKCSGFNIFLVTVLPFFQKSSRQDGKTEALKQIDKLVYDLYGLTPEEIEIVEGKR